MNNLGHEKERIKHIHMRLETLLVWYKDGGRDHIN